MSTSDWTFTVIWLVSIWICWWPLIGTMSEPDPGESLALLDHWIGSRALAPAVAGFSFFPIINTLIVVWLIVRALSNGERR